MVNFPYRKAEGIFYYLCVRRLVTRDELVSTFWGGLCESAGRRNLRQVLYELKNCLGEDILIISGRDHIQLNADRFEEGNLERVMEPESDSDEFLHFFYIKGCPEFERWVENVRIQQRIRLMDSIHDLLKNAERRNKIVEMQQLIRRMISLDPLSADYVEEAMDLYSRNGMYQLAIQVYNEYKSRLQEELDEEPDERIQKAFHRAYQLKEAGVVRSVHGRTSFYERSRESYFIYGELQKFRCGEKNCSVIIRGDMGVGKTALMEYMEQINRGLGVLTLVGYVAEFDTGFYLRVWMDIFRQIARYQKQKLIHLPGRDQHFLEQFLYGSESTELMLENLPSRASLSKKTVSGMLWFENRIIDLFRSLAAEKRIILCIDDIQWMDQIGYQLLSTLFNELGGSSLYMIATCRDDVIGSDVQNLIVHMLKSEKVKSVELRPFTFEETANILSMRYADKIEEFPLTVDEVYHRTEGNALMLMDLLDVIDTEEQVPEILPELTSQALAVHLLKLTGDQRRLLEVLSMYVESADMDEIQVLFPADVLTIYSLLEELERFHLIKERLLIDTISYGFRHRIYKDYIYREMSQGKRVICHRMIADFYERQRKKSNWFEYLPFLIYQCEKSGQQDKADQYRVQYYCEVYSLNYEDFPVLRTRMDYDEPVGGLRSGEEETLELANRLLGAKSELAVHVQAECYFLIGRFAIARGKYEEGVKNIQECIRVSEKHGNRSLFLAACRQMIIYGQQTDQVEIMDQYIHLGMEMLSGSGNVSDKAVFLQLKGYSLYRQNCLEAAEKIIRESVRILSSMHSGDSDYRLTQASSFNILGKIRIQQSKEEKDDLHRRERLLDEAEALFYQAIEVGTVRYFTNGMGQIRCNLGETYMHQNKFAEARASLLDAVEYFQRNGFYWGWDRTEAYLVLVCRKLGLYQEAEEHLALAETMIPIIQNPQNMALLEECRKY